MNNVAVESSSKKSWIILVTAIVLGGLAAWLSSFYLDYKEDQIRDSLTGKKEVKVPIVVPKFKVGPGDIISGCNMVVRKVPKRYVPDGAFNPSQFEGLRFTGTGRIYLLGYKISYKISYHRGFLVPNHFCFYRLNFEHMWWRE